MKKVDLYIFVLVSTFIAILTILLIFLKIREKNETSNGNESTTEEEKSFVDKEYEEITISNSEPILGESDEIILYDERYYLCKRIDSAFATNSEEYGIYDSRNNSWAMDYMEIPIGDFNERDFKNLGCGVFAFDYYSGKTNEVYHCFLSADLNGYFHLKLSDELDDLYFVNGKAIAEIHVKAEEFVDGVREPDEKLYLVSTMGEIQEVIFDGDLYGVNYYWEHEPISYRDDLNIYARCFKTYNITEGRPFLYIYFRDTDKYIIIEDTDYTDRITVNCKVFMADDLVRVFEMIGDDGNEYYADFDRNGNIVTPATLISDLYS